MNSKKTPFCNLRIVEDDEVAGAYIRKRMCEYSRLQVVFNKEVITKTICLTLKDSANQLLGGVIAFISNYWSRCFIDILWIEEKYRNLGYGSQFLKTIEEIAINMNCKIVTVNTASFQAPKFYIKHGYELYGTINNFPTEEHSEYSFKKILESISNS